MFGDRFSSSTICPRWRHETEPGRLDQSLSCRFWKVATHPLGANMDLLTHLTTLVAAFSGAWFAFLLNDRAKARETTRQQVAALNRAQFTLIRQGSCLAEPLWMRHKAKHGNEKQIRKACKDF